MKKTTSTAANVIELSGREAMALLDAAFGPSGYGSAWKVNAVRENSESVRVAVRREEGGERTMRVRLPETFPFEILEEIG